jgi:superfamily II DNA or RNA helicase
MSLDEQKSLNFPVVITSFEMCIIDRPFLENYIWQYLILDEGHRIKNRNCKLVKELKSFKSVSRLLLTGTPIQVFFFFFFLNFYKFFFSFFLYIFRYIYFYIYFYTFYLLFFLMQN